MTISFEKKDLIYFGMQFGEKYFLEKKSLLLKLKIKMSDQRQQVF